MTKIKQAIKLALLGTSTLAAGMASALDLSFKPRIEGGIANYEYEMDAFSQVIGSSTSTIASGNNIITGHGMKTQTPLKLLDNIGFLGGGLTVVADRFFFDIGAKKFLSGSDNANLEGGTNINASVAGTTTGVSESWTRNTSFDTDIDRFEYALALGYSINDAISVFGGWKWAETELDFKSTGTFALTANTLDDNNDGNIANDPFHTIRGSTQGRTEAKFKYNGPFLGTAYGLNIPEANGGLTFKFAVAFLDGKVTNKSTGGSFTITSIDGQEPGANKNPGDLGADPFFDSKGDTVGWNFGVAWRGDTSIQGLGYTAGIDVYQYKFDAKGDKDPNINEQVISFNLGAAYAF